VTLRSKLVLPINMILVLVLGAALAWEWRRSEATELAVLHARLDEEARFIRAAHESLGGSTRFADYLGAFCHATDAAASPEHQVALVVGGSLIAEAAVHARQPMDPLELAGLGEGAWLRWRGQESYLVRVSDQEGRKVVVAESTRALRARVGARILMMAGWYLGLGIVLLAAVNAVMRRTVLSPIRRLSRAVRLLEQGQLGVQVDATGGDELGALGRRFNAMSRVIAEQAESDRRELETARRVQAHLLPPPESRIGRLEFAGRCIQAGPVGGDLYDVQPLPGDRVGILVADLSGHNVAAALHTAMVRAIVWREAEQAASPGEVLERLNERLCRDLPEEHFATAFFGWFDARSGRLHYANAGHPPAYLLPPGGLPRELGPTGPLLGVMPGFPHGSETVDMEAGGALLAYTDGLSETMGRDGELWGTDEMLAIFRSGGADDPARVVARLRDRVAAFRGPGTPQDDVTLIIAKHMPSTVDVGSTPA